MFISLYFGPFLEQYMYDKTYLLYHYLIYFQEKKLMKLDQPFQSEDSDQLYGTVFVRF